MSKLDSMNESDIEDLLIERNEYRRWLKDVVKLLNALVKEHCIELSDDEWAVLRGHKKGDAA